ncbi:MAG TPA: 4-hydroxy-3-methylbut-2-enyl diphosphate reductase [Gaiellaceae bacterium]|nr:4-hydroxy-3-methylbut-2-enyl diphosphate reductase [Gaiellaceae bacterium]
MTVVAPLRSEQVALRLGGVRAVRGGMGGRAHAVEGDVVVVAGVCGAVEPSLRAGDVVVATEIRDGEWTRELSGWATLARSLRDRGLRVVTGPVQTADRVLGTGERDALRAEGVVAVDMETTRLAPRDGVPFAVVRTVVDAPGKGLLHPRTLVAGVKALDSLRRSAPAIREWAAATGPRRVLLSSPRSFCAGVDRAIEIVERAIEQRGAPIYVRKQIVHNRHVVGDLEERGAVFVDELDEVPDGATVVFSAHGVSPLVKSAATERGLDVIDATCPLVNKVHAEARTFAKAGKTIVLVGHEGHEEVEGTTGEAPDAIKLVEHVEDVAKLDIDDADEVAYLTQTTLAVDDAMVVVEELRRRFPKLVGPKSDDICYATQNRQQALRAIAREADLVLVVGSENSSNSVRLVEVAEKEGTPGRLIDDETDLDAVWLAGKETIALTAGASAPEELVQRVISELAGLGAVTVEDRTVGQESIRFNLPREVSS